MVQPEYRSRKIAQDGFEDGLRTSIGDDGLESRVALGEKNSG